MYSSVLSSFLSNKKASKVLTRKRKKANEKKKKASFLRRYNGRDGAGVSQGERPAEERAGNEGIKVCEDQNPLAVGHRVQWSECRNVGQRRVGPHAEDSIRGKGARVRRHPGVQGTRRRGTDDGSRKYPALGVRAVVV